MQDDTVLSRDPDDGRRYKVSYLSHWSEIENVNDPSDKHHVKWYGGCPRSKQELYVSHEGIGFKALPRDNGEKR